jgi:hypothetical protein
MPIDPNIIKHPIDYQSGVDLWKDVELTLQAEKPYAAKLTEEEKEYCKKAVELLGSGNYSVQLINEYNGKTYTLILEHHQTGEELKFDFTYSLPIQGIPSLGGSKEAVGEKISQQNEFVKNLLESFIK